MTTRSRWVGGVAAAVAVVASFAVLPAGTARAATSAVGFDFSWPQCPQGVGNGQGKPLPAATHAFDVVGLTNGVGLHENPCLASQWAYAKAHATYVTGYTMLTYPTARQITAARTGHYGTCSTLTCRLRNNGWAQGEFADASMRRIGAHPPLVWVDVEPRHQQPWSGSTARNSLVVKAAIASLQRHGYRVGIYSNRAMWRRTARYSTSLPEWVPAGSTTVGCGLSFAGGPVWMSQDGYYDPARHAGYDENGLCGRAPALSRIYQPHHPWVTTGVRTTGWAQAHYTDGGWFGLGLRVAAPPTVARVVDADGRVPLFVAVDRTHAAYARTLSSRWVPLNAGFCATTPGVTVSGTTAWVGCLGATHAMTTAQLTLNDAGTPVSATASDWGGHLSAPPGLTTTHGVPRATATFRDGLVYQRTASSDWTPTTQPAPGPPPTSTYIG